MPIDKRLDEDPGWPISPAKLLLLMVPGYIARANQSTSDGLLLTRQVFVSFTSALVLFQVVLFFIGTTDQPTNTGLAVGFLAMGLLSVFVIAPVLERQAVLDCTDEPTLAGSYRTRFFLRIAFAESAALLGFVGFFVANLWWVYPVSLISAAVGFLRLAPTRANLAEDQRLLRERGCNLSLVAALRQPKAA